MINVSEFNRRIVLTAYDYVEGNSGGIVPIFKEALSKWAKVEQKRGFTATAEAQQQSVMYYQVTMRYEKSVNENWIISYEKLTLKINDIDVKEEGYKRYQVLNCSVTLKFENWS